MSVDTSVEQPSKILNDKEKAGKVLEHELFPQSLVQSTDSNPDFFTTIKCGSHLEHQHLQGGT